MDSAGLPDPQQEPRDPANCRVEMTIRVGPVGDDSGDDFTLSFVTRIWLAEHIGPDEFRSAGLHGLLSRFLWSVAERAARTLIASAEAGSWDEFVEGFSRLAYWEYSRAAPPS